MMDDKKEIKLPQYLREQALRLVGRLPKRGEKVFVLDTEGSAAMDWIKRISPELFKEENK